MISACSPNHRAGHVGAVVLSAVLGACASRDLSISYEKVRSECGLAPDDFVLESDDGQQFQYPIDENCSARLAREVGLEWTEFAAEPHAIGVAKSADEGVIAALFTIVSTDLGSVTDLRSAEGLPLWIAEIVDESGSSLDGDAPAGALWWSIVTSNVNSIHYDPTSTHLFYYSSDQVVTVGQLTTKGAEGEALSEQPVELASLLVHEAGHAVALPHVQCPASIDPELRWQCDETPNETVGAAAWWLSAWLDQYAGDDADVSEVHCNVVQGQLRIDCDKILSKSEFGPCLGQEYCSR